MRPILLLSGVGAGHFQKLPRCECSPFRGIPKVSQICFRCTPGDEAPEPTRQDQVPRVDLHHGGLDSIDGGYDHSIHKTSEHQIANFGRWNMPLSRWNITHTAGCGFSPRLQVLHMKFGPSGSNRRCTLGILFFTASVSFLALERRLRQTQHSGGILDACTAPWHSI